MTTASSTPRSSLPARLLIRFAGFLETHPAIPLLFLAAVYILSALSGSRSKPLWHDELFTYWIAQAPSWKALLGELRAIDLNPPLVYLATRASFRLFGVSTLCSAFSSRCSSRGSFRRRSTTSSIQRVCHRPSRP